MRDCLERGRCSAVTLALPVLADVKEAQAKG